MSKTYISETLRQRVAEQARYRCGYCQALQSIVGYPLHIEHILPEAAGGASIENNLWLACSMCNSYKGTQTHAIDPVTQIETPLFNPREQAWSQHFTWSDDGAQVIGLAPTGRATVVALQLNTPFRIHTRQRWMSVGWHPPRD